MSAALSNLPIVCLVTGDFHGRADLYLRRLYAMLARHCPVPFTLHCFCDQPRIAPPNVQLHSCEHWSKVTDPAMRPTTKKLQFFDANTVPFDEFLYLDISLVIRRDMNELLKFAFGQTQDLVIVNDWNYASYNSSVMRIRRGALQTIYDAFASGQRYPQQVPGSRFHLCAHRGARLARARRAFPGPTDRQL